MYQLFYSATFCSLITLAIEAITSFSSSPSATISTVALVGTPKDITPMIDFKLTSFPLYTNLISLVNLLAWLTKIVAGLACNPTGSDTPERGFQNEPQRCKACRDARKNAARGPREYFTAVCANCGGEARVPFEPKSDRPVYCSECFAKMREQG